MTTDDSKLERTTAMTAGGLIGRLIMMSHNASHPFCVNDDITCFWIDDHWSVARIPPTKTGFCGARIDRTPISDRLLHRIASEIIGLSDYDISTIDDNIRNITPKGNK